MDIIKYNIAMEGRSDFLLMCEVGIQDALHWVEVYRKRYKHVGYKFCIVGVQVSQ